jgi:putative hydrolase of the HAD superfamily
MKIKNIVFDLGNVIVKWAPLDILKAVFPNQSAEQFYQDIRPIWIQLNLGQITEKEAIILYHNQLNIPKEKAAEMLNAFKTSQLPIPGMLELLSVLHEQGAPLYAITDNVKEIIEWHRTHSNFLHYFKDVVVSADIGILKPDQRIYRYLLDKYKLVASETVFIDDVLVNVKGAEAVGMQAFQFTDVSSCIEKLKDLKML